MAVAARHEAGRTLVQGRNRQTAKLGPPRGDTRRYGTALSAYDVQQRPAKGRYVEIADLCTVPRCDGRLMASGPGK